MCSSLRQRRRRPRDERRPRPVGLDRRKHLVNGARGSPPGSRSRSTGSRACRSRAAAARARSRRRRAAPSRAARRRRRAASIIVDRAAARPRRRTSRCRRSRRRRHRPAIVFEMSTTRPRRICTFISSSPSGARRRPGRRPAARPRGARVSRSSSSCGWTSTSQFMTTKPSGSRGRASHSEYRLLVCAKRVFSTNVHAAAAACAARARLRSRRRRRCRRCRRRAGPKSAARSASGRRRAPGISADRRPCHSGARPCRPPAPSPLIGRSHGHFAPPSLPPNRITFTVSSTMVRSKKIDRCLM